MPIKPKDYIKKDLAGARGMKFFSRVHIPGLYISCHEELIRDGYSLDLKEVDNVLSWVISRR